jgi:hypothetical protein
VEKAERRLAPVVDSPSIKPVVTVPKVIGPYTAMEAGKAKLVAHLARATPSPAKLVEPVEESVVRIPFDDGWNA